MAGAGVILLLIGLILVGIDVLVVIVADMRSCLVFLVGLAGLIMIIIGVIFLASETKIVSAATSFYMTFLHLNGKSQ